MFGSHHRIWFNTIYNAGRDIVFPGGTNHDIRYNDLYNPGMLCKDLGVVYGGYNDAQGTRIAYNWVHDVPATAVYYAGIYLDNYNRNFRVDHNVVWNCVGGRGIAVAKPSFGSRIYNNTLFNCGDFGDTGFNPWPNNNPDPAVWTSDVYDYAAANNLFLGTTPAAQLINYANRDFGLLTNAPAINSGVVLPGYTDGFLGAAPDKGAYESGGARWTAGVNGIAAEGPFVTNGTGASNLQTTSATLNGEVSGTYFQATRAVIYWGQTDGGTNSAAWTNSKPVDLTADGSLRADLTGLTPNIIYYYRCFASNVTSQAWADATIPFLTAPGSAPASGSRLINISTRGLVPVGGALTPGFVLRGTGGKNLVIRSIGPTLGAFGITAALADTKLEVFNQATSARTHSNDDWGGAAPLTDAFGAVGAFQLPANSKDAAVAALLPVAASAGYSVRITAGGAAASGLALAEVYDAEPLTSPVRLINVSVLGFVGIGENVLTPGFVIGGTASKLLLIRAIGPGLAQFGVGGLLDDPQLQVIPAGQSNVLASNNDWGGTAALKAAFAQAGAFSLTETSKDAAVIIRVPPGGYTVQVAGAGNTAGTALVEVYDLDP